MLSEFYILHPTPHHQRPTTVFTHLHLHPSFSKDFIADAAGIAFLFVAILLAFQGTIFQTPKGADNFGQTTPTNKFGFAPYVSIVFVASSDCLLFM